VGYGPSDELPHQPSDDPRWQESVFVQWFDDAAGIAGFHRIGHEPNLGTSVVWCGVVTQDGLRFRRVVPDVPLQPEDRKDGLAAGLHAVLVEGDALRVTVNEGDCEVDVLFDNFYPIFGLWAEDEAAALTESVAAGHFECSGRVTGKARIGDRTVEVEGLGHRDHSWGVRHWNAWNSHRWCTGSFGPELSFAAFTSQLPDGALLTGGFVVRDGTPERAESAEVVVHMEADGLTHRGGEATLRLVGGDRIHLRCEAMDGMVFHHHDSWLVDTACRVRDADGRRGVCNLEVSNNPLRGTSAPSLALRAAMADGLSNR
jgi:hypothetical protein